jgi:DNA adenine methylase
MIAKPFIKWAGGKTQLINKINELIPSDFINNKFTYVEPFVGGGAMLFNILNNHSDNLKSIVINDINKDLINVYKIIKTKPEELIFILSFLEKKYHELDNDEEKKKEYYYEKRNIFNKLNINEKPIYKAALFIFLNKTCFNGLFRVNKSNHFNVPMGSYKKPMICDTDNIMAVHNKLKDVEILSGDYQDTLKNITYNIDTNVLFYLDPPYRPLNATSNFNSYSKEDFNDDEQIRLKEFCDKINYNGYNFILSNSDPKNNDVDDNFFDDLYKDYKIIRTNAKRNINSDSEKRGNVTELLITNF